MPIMTDPKELADTIERATHVMLRFAYNDLHQLREPEIQMIVAALRGHGAAPSKD